MVKLTKLEWFKRDMIAIFYEHLFILWTFNLGVYSHINTHT